jgi:ADP-heptose:LPS heptosyltransferase
MKSELPPPEKVENILVWHTGALGDLLLAGPALQALSRHYPGSGLVGVGKPEGWKLLQGALPVKAVWDADDGLWAWLFAAAGAVPPRLAERLAGVSLALVFSPRPNPEIFHGLSRAGVRAGFWLPSFSENGYEPVRWLQARHLANLGLSYEPKPFYLDLEVDLPEGQHPSVLLDKPLLSVAPGSGSARKNWPLSHYFEVTRVLAWDYGLQVVWLAGPAETAWLPYLRGIAESQGHALLAGLPLEQVARVLARSHLYLGGDSGITHLAAAAKARRIIALFGPTDPRVWAPFGDGVTVVTAPCDCAPCTGGRDIPCPEPWCLRYLSPKKVLEIAASLVAAAAR